MVRSIEGAEGLIAAHWAVGRENGGRVSVMVWESPDAAAGAFLGSRLEVFAHAGHGVFRDKPNEALAVIADFILS